METITELGISQYTFEELGNSACTSISCVAAAKLMETLNAGQNIDDPLILSDVLTEGVNYYASARSNVNGPDHMSVDEFLVLCHDVNRRLLKLNSLPIQGVLEGDYPFTKLLNEAISVANKDLYLSVVITKPPETISIILPPSSTNVNTTKHYYLFDSHSRPQFGIYGAYLVKCQRIEDLHSRLQLIFPSFESTASSDDYYLSMFNSFEAFIFQLNS